MQLRFGRSDSGTPSVQAIRAGDEVGLVVGLRAELLDLLARERWDTEDRDGWVDRIVLLEQIYPRVHPLTAANRFGKLLNDTRKTLVGLGLPRTLIEARGPELRLSPPSGGVEFVKN